MNNSPFEWLINDLWRELAKLNDELKPPPSPHQLLALIVFKRFRYERGRHVEQLEQLRNRALKVTAKANSAIDTVVRAERDVYHLREFSEILTWASLLRSRIDDFQAMWNMERR